MRAWSYRRFVEEGLRGKIASPAKGAIEKVLLGSDEWVENMRHVLGPAEADSHVAGLRQLAWRPWQDPIGTAVAEEFGVARSSLFGKRIKNKDARIAAFPLIRKRPRMSGAQLARQYGGVSQAGISKAIKRAEVRRDQQRRWKQRLGRLEASLRTGG